MKRVTWKDEYGYSHISLLRDTDNELHPEIGIPLEPPPIEKILCDAGMDVREALVLRGIVTYQDLLKDQDGVSSTLRLILVRRIVEAYKLKEIESNGK